MTTNLLTFPSIEKREFDFYKAWVKSLSFYSLLEEAKELIEFLPESPTYEIIGQIRLVKEELEVFAVLRNMPNHTCVAEINRKLGEVNAD